MPACFAWFLPCVYSARNVDADGTTISASPAKNDGKAAQFEKNLEKAGQEPERDTNDVSTGKGCENRAGFKQSNDSSGPELRQERTPWMVKEAASDRGKQQGGAVSVVGQVGSLHRQEENSPHSGSEDEAQGKMFFEARSTPRWGQQSSPAKPSGKPENNSAAAGNATSNHLQQAGAHNSKVRSREIGAPCLIFRRPQLARTQSTVHAPPNRPWSASLMRSRWASARAPLCCPARHCRIGRIAP
jgi:hypothetical protein